MVAWLSCGDTSLVTWADSHDAGGNRGGEDERVGTSLISHEAVKQLTHFFYTNLFLPDLFLHSISYPVMGLLPSKPMVQRRAMVRSLTSRISTSGGSGGSEETTERYISSAVCDFPSERFWPESNCAAIKLINERFK